MHYQISRNGQFYGPYTLDDLRRYVSTGNVLASDLAKSEEMAEWVTVEQLLAAPVAPAPLEPVAAPTAPEAVQQPVYATFPQQPVYADTYTQPLVANPLPASSPYEDAPNLQYGLVLLFTVLSCGLFAIIWDIVIATWLRRVQPSDRSLYWYAGAVGAYILEKIVGFALLGTGLRYHPGSSNLFGGGFMGVLGISFLISLAVPGLIITANFIKRTSLLEHFNGPEPVGLQLSGPMTFFFGPVYFQYHLNKINGMKQAARYGSPIASGVR